MLLGRVTLRRMSVLAACAAALAACTTEEPTSPLVFNDPVILGGSPMGAVTAHIEQRWEWPDIALPNGQKTRIMWMEKGMPAQMMAMLKEMPQWKAVTASVGAGLQVDPNATAKSPEAWGAIAGSDPLVLTGEPPAIDAVTELITSVLTSIPQIAIEARVVEVLEGDESALGLEWFMFNRGDNPAVTNPMNPNTVLSPSATNFDRGWLGSGAPLLPGGSAFMVPDLLLEMGTIVDDFQVELLLSALRSFNKVDVVNAPNVAVLSGHIASILAGQEVPVYQLSLQGGTTVISTSFKNIAVSLDVMPHLLAPNIIRMAVSVRVQSVTGGTTVSIGSSQTTNPVVANRSVSTTLEVRDGATVMLGGLLTTNKHDAESRVPILGDIPLVGALFTNTHSRDQRSNLIFFIRPKVITRGSSVGNGVITPPADPLK